MDLTDNERDILLWNQFKAGDENAFVALFKKYYSRLFNYGSKISSDPGLVEDCIQELFSDLWRTAGKAEIISFNAYTFRSFKFKLVKQVTKNALVRKWGDDLEENEFELSHDNFMVKNDFDSARKERMLSAFKELSPRQKEIIYLKFYQDLSYGEVGEIMQISYQAARNLTYQSIKLLKKITSGFFCW